MARSWIGLTGIILIVAMALGGQLRAAEPIQVIAAFNLTGPDSGLDAPSYNGAKLAAQQINASGGVLGRPIELIGVDTASDEATTAEKVGAALKAHPKAVAGIGFAYNSYVLRAGPLFQAARLPFVSPGATGPRVPGQVGDYMFLIAYSDDAQARTMAAFVRNELKLSEAAVWTDTERDYSRTVGRVFAQAFAELGGRVQVHDYTSPKTDFSDLIAKARAANPRPQAIYAANAPSAAARLIGQARSQGLEVALLSGDGWDEEDIVALSKRNRIGGVYFTTHRFLGVDTPEMKAFIGAYAKRYGEAPPNAFVPLGFDAVSLLANAIERARSASPDAIRSALAATRDFPGLVGDISYPPNRRIPDKVVSVIRLDNGVEKVVWTGRVKWTGGDP